MDSIEVNTSTRASNDLWKPAFLSVFAETGNASAAADAAGVDHSTPYYAKQSDPEFKQAWENAKLVAADALRAEAWRRAVTGGRSYKFNKAGQPLMHPDRPDEPYFEMVYSDALLTLLLKAYAPDEFKDRSAVETTAPPAPKYDLTRLSPAELNQLEALTRAATPPEA